jgi:pantothenate kinase-related protein Tda10
MIQNAVSLQKLTPPLNDSCMHGFLYFVHFVICILLAIYDLTLEGQRLVDAHTRPLCIAVVGSKFTGKTTLSKQIARSFGSVYVSFESAVRSAIRRRSEVGKKVLLFIGIGYVNF